MRRRRSDAPAAASPATAALSRQVASQVGRMREALSHLIEFSGMSRREVEQRLLQESCGTNLGRLLNGGLDLKMKHVLAICRVIDLEPVEFLRIALKPQPGHRSPLLLRIEALLPYTRAEAAPPASPTRPPSAGDLLQQAQDLAQQLNEVLRQAACPATADGARRSAPGPRLP